MSFKDYPDDLLISELDVLKKMTVALSKKKPFSLVRIGDGENIVMGQYTFLPEEEFLNTYWIKESIGNKDKGVKLPCLALKEKMIKSVKKADVVGVCWRNKDDIRVPSKFRRELTNEIFDLYNIRPPNLCHVFVNRKMVSQKLFWKLLCQYRTLLVSKWSHQFAKLAAKKYERLKPKIIGCINFKNYHEIPKTLDAVGKYQFDLVLISAGVNAVVLATEIAERFHKVAIDFGKTMMLMVMPESKVDPWKKIKLWVP